MERVEITMTEAKYIALKLDNVLFRDIYYWSTQTVGVTLLPSFGTDSELSGMDSRRSWRKKMIDRRVVISRAIFSPESGGSAKPRTLMNEMNTHGNTRLKMK